MAKRVRLSIVWPSRLPDRKQAEAHPNRPSEPQSYRNKPDAHTAAVIGLLWALVNLAVLAVGMLAIALLTIGAKGVGR